jgi:hypothetical protein
MSQSWWRYFSPRAWVWGQGGNNNGKSVWQKRRLEWGVEKGELKRPGVQKRGPNGFLRESYLSWAKGDQGSQRAETRMSTCRGNAEWEEGSEDKSLYGPRLAVPWSSYCSAWMTGGVTGFMGPSRSRLASRNCSRWFTQEQHIRDHRLMKPAYWYVLLSLCDVVIKFSQYFR